VASQIFTSRRFRNQFTDTFLAKGKAVLGVLGRHAESGASLDWQALSL
jgi:hypothetical protein